MQKTDLATRAYNRTYRIDPIIRSLLDTDFYKLLMLQMIWEKFPDTQVKFQLFNRTKSVRIADDIPIEQLREQLDHVRTLRFTEQELIWLSGNTFYGKVQMFKPDFIAWLRTFQLGEYRLEIVDGQFLLTFPGDWKHTMMWEIPALAIINELRSRHVMRDLSYIQLDVLYGRAKARLWDKIETLRDLKERHPGALKITDFGTRRRHGFLWQDWCVQAMREGLGDSFIGSSNVHLAQKHSLEAIGTNAHELAMVYAALADGDEALKQSRYDLLRDWEAAYDSRLRIILPDAFGTTSFLADAPEWVADWTGIRPDSKEPIEAGEEYLAWLAKWGRDPMKKVLIFSDGMDTPSIVECFNTFVGRVGAVSFGWGTNLTNDFGGLAPLGDRDALKGLSLVCKVVEADGRPAVKLSDNPTKAIGPRSEIDRYLRVFGQAGMATKAVTV